MRRDRRNLETLYRLLLVAYGPQEWWPGDTPFESAVGAILTQNTNWENAEKALGNLRAGGCLTPKAMAALTREHLAELIRPSGCFNVKAGRISSFLRYLEERHGGSMERLAGTPRRRLRRELLQVDGIGPETADSILLYAAGHPVFVVDAYTRRIFSRHGRVRETIGYDRLQEFFHRRLPRDADLYNEYHALIVKLGKERCRSSKPLCAGCPLET